MHPLDDGHLLTIGRDATGGSRGHCTRDHHRDRRDVARERTLSANADEDNSCPVWAFEQMDAKQEIDQLSLMRPVTKDVLRINRAERAADIMRQAFRIAMSGQRGPVHVDIPRDLLRENPAFEFPDPDRYRASSRQTPANDEIRRALDLIFDAVNAEGGIGGERIGLVEVDAVGSVDRVLAGARRLAADGCVLILGPAVTDFAVPLVPVLDEIEVPALNWSGSARARGAWGFQLKVGSLPDEAGHLTRLVAARGHRRVAVARDRGPIGDEYFAIRDYSEE
jgi:hypothetical protein